MIGRDWLEAGARYEYPAYGLYIIAIPWMLTATLISLLSLPHSKPHPEDTNVSEERSETSADSKQTLQEEKDSLFLYVFRKIVCGLAPFTLFVVGMCPYLGVRTYSALAMFSNLRVEGNDSKSFKD